MSKYQHYTYTDTDNKTWIYEYIPSEKSWVVCKISNMISTKIKENRLKVLAQNEYGWSEEKTDDFFDALRLIDRKLFNSYELNPKPTKQECKRAFFELVFDKTHDEDFRGVERYQYKEQLKIAHPEFDFKN